MKSRNPHRVREPITYRAPIPDWPEDERPREKLMQLGPERLTDAELLAILLRTGNRQQTALDLAKALLAQHGNIANLARLPYQQLATLKGVGPVKAVTLNAAFELGRRLAALPGVQKLKITAPEIVHQRYAPLMAHLKKEVFKILILNSANVLIRDVTISEGILDSALVHPREVFKIAILESAASIILIHNHPSGETTPSSEDHRITQRLVEVGNIMGIPVLDHVIIAAEQYFSFQESGLIPETP